jgi:CheY-like chemotaxis protein
MSVSILVVDDEPDVADLFRQSFRREARQGTYVMHFAASGQEALDRLSEEIKPPSLRVRGGCILVNVGLGRVAADDHVSGLYARR